MYLLHPDISLPQTNMYCRVVIGILVIIAASPEMINGCDHRSVQTEKERGNVGKVRSVETPIIVGESGVGLLLRTYNSGEAPKDNEAEELFRKIDTNSDGKVDAAEWIHFSKRNSFLGFVKLLEYTNVDDDEAVSLEEFLSVQQVKIEQPEEYKDDLDKVLS